jgi:3-hydroxybutyryl-CoA dehydratase
MSQMRPAPEFSIGAEIAGPIKAVTAERIEWYDSGMLSTAKGELANVGDNIHTDDKFARNQGLPAVILDGMVSTNWCQNMLIEHFGMDYIERGSLRTKYIKPIYLNDTVYVKARVLSVDRRENGDVAYRLDVWCETDANVKVVDGDAAIVVAARR